MPQDPEINEWVEQILHETEDMPEQDQQEVLPSVRMKNNLHQLRRK